MKLTDAQYQINRQASIQTDYTNEWLKHNGIQLKQFSKINPRILLAQQTAHRLLTDYKLQLTNAQLKTIQYFTNKYKNSKLCTKITDAECFAVLNIQSKLNRQHFKQYRLSK